MAFLVLTCGQTSRETDRSGVALLRKAVNVRTTRVGKVKKTTNLIEGLASSVIKGSAELTNIRCDVINKQKIRVATGDDQTDETLGQRTFCELIDGKVTDHVINPVQRFSN